MPVPLHRLFDYAVPDPLAMPEPGARVSVSFHGRILVGVVMTLNPADAYGKVKPVDSVLDDRNVFGTELFELGKWLAGEQKIFLLDEVTAGIDVGAKFEIYELVGDLTEAGAAVILATSDIQEAMGLCDRLLVMHRGTIVAELIPEDTTREEVLLNMMGGGVHNEVQSG